MENKYQNSKIYKIVCNITGEIYIGSTIRTLNQRLLHHKILKNCISRNIINRCDYKIELIKNYPCNSKYKLEEEEAKYIRENECINITVPHRTNQEYYKDNKKEINKKNQEYYKKNTEKIKEHTKKYYEINKEKIKEQQKEWNEDNKEKVKQYKQKYKEKNREQTNKKLKEKVECECGSIIRKNDISKHRRTKKHIKLLEEKSM